MRFLHAGIFAVAALPWLPAHAARPAPSTIGCGDTVLSPGAYVLRASCTCEGNGPCIKVSADNVLINLDNKTLTCAPRNPPRERNDTTFGIQASSLRNFTLMGADPAVAKASGKITGCYMGLHAGDGSNLFVDRVDFSGNTYVGVNTAFSTDVLLTRNTVDGIAGYVGANGHNAYAIAFYGCGTRCVVSSNMVRNVPAQAHAMKPVEGEGVGVVISAGSTGAVVAYNWFENTDESLMAIAVRASDGASGIVENNSMTGFWHGVSGTGSLTVKDNRIMMRKASRISQSYGVYGKPGSGCAADNLIVNYPIPVAPGLPVCGGRNMTYR